MEGFHWSSLCSRFIYIDVKMEINTYKIDIYFYFVPFRTNASSSARSSTIYSK